MEVNEQIMGLGQNVVDENELAAALAQFDPVWESLSSREQAKVIRLLVERVGYDRGAGTVSLTFRAAGIKELAAEAVGEEVEV
jgi:site-specific DNA recombinase